MPPEVKVALYRITQEALNNVAKHAGASQARVSLRCHEGRITLSVTDDGCGFDMTRLRPDSLGLGIIRERAREIGATLEVNSEAGKGTRITVIWENRSRRERT